MPKVKVKMPPRLPNISPPQLECGTCTAKIHSVRMPHRPFFKFFVFGGSVVAQIPHLECLQTMNFISYMIIGLFFWKKDKEREADKIG